MTNNLEEKIARIVEEGMWTVESQQSNLDYTIPKLLDLFTSYANEVANKARIDELELMDSEIGIIALVGQNVLKEAKKHIAYRLDQLRTKTGEK